MDKPRMTEGQLRRARKLIRRLCANYDEGNCLALDEGEGCVCVQSISYSLLCRYFKEAVLPAAAELCAALGQGAGGLNRCRPCGACPKLGCPAISGRSPVIDAEKCVGCGMCASVCKCSAIRERA